jgi:Predicted phosphatases
VQVSLQQRAPKVILFDMDGTLIDTMPIFADIAAQILEDYAGVSIIEGRRRYLETSGVPFAAQLKSIAPGHHAHADMIRLFEQSKVRATARIQIEPRIQATLKMLQKRGIRVGISSNNCQANVDRFAQSAGVGFDFALGWTSTLSKGAPHFFWVSRKLNCYEQEMLFVGDSLVDAGLAADARVPFVAVTSTFSRADFRAHLPGTVCIPDVSSLLGYLKKSAIVV